MQVLLGRLLLRLTTSRFRFSAIRVPIGLVLEARPTDNFNLYLGLEYAYNNYPGPSTYLGQNTTTARSNTSGTASALPFTIFTNGSPYSQQVDNVYLTQAYFTYQTAIGLFKAGAHAKTLGFRNI